MLTKSSRPSPKFPDSANFVGGEAAHVKGDTLSLREAIFLQFRGKFVRNLHGRRVARRRFPLWKTLVGTYFYLYRV